MLYSRRRNPSVGRGGSALEEGTRGLRASEKGWKLKRQAGLCSVSSTETAIGTVQRLAWPLRQDDMQICEAFHVSKKLGCAY